MKQRLIPLILLVAMLASNVAASTPNSSRTSSTKAASGAPTIPTPPISDRSNPPADVALSSGGASVARPRSEEYDQYGGWNALPITNPDGYFRSAVISGTAWLVTPDGHAFFSMGVDWISFGDPAHQQVSDNYDQRMLAKYGNAQAWADATSQQVLSWNMNTIGAFSGADIRHHGIAETRHLNLGLGSTDAPYNTPRMNSRFPDVYAPGWAITITQIVSNSISEQDTTDPWLLGYYTDNEMYWFSNGGGHDNSTMTEAYIAQSRDSAGKQAWVQLLAANYQTIDALNVAWGTSYASFTGTEQSSLLNVTSINAPAAYPDKFQFLHQIAARYYQITTTAIRTRDPNHLLLGDRFYLNPPYQEVVEEAARYNDVISINLYNTPDNPLGDDMQMEYLDELLAWSSKPVMIGEFSLLGLDSGMPNQPIGVAHMVPTDRDRASGYQQMLRESAHRPMMVGVHWFQHADRGLLNTHSLGGYYGHHNWGFVDIDGNPYPQLAKFATLYNANIYYHHQTIPAAQPEPPTTIQPLFEAPVFSSTVRFAWKPVLGANGYTWQAAQTPDFASPIAASVAATVYTPTVGTFAPGRWYWRVRASSPVSDELAYSAPQPFTVLQQTDYQLINGFENPSDSQLDNPGAAWASWNVSGTISITPTTAGRTEGALAGLLTFNGHMRNGQDDWVEVSRAPNGDNFTPRDWRGYDYLTLDLSRDSDIPAPLFTLNISDDANNPARYWKNHSVRQGTAQFAMSLGHEDGWWLDYSHIADLKLGGRRPLTGTQIVLDNLALRAVAHDQKFQPPITAIVSDATVSGTLDIDWRSYQPATTTVAYRIYVTDIPNTPIDQLQPIITIDAVAQHSRLRVQKKPGGVDPDGFEVLHNWQTFYVTVVPLDMWGNVGQVGPSVAAVPTACTTSFSDVPQSLWAWFAIKYLACHQIVSGVGGDQFQPNAPASRIQFAKMITLARGWPLITPAQPSFTDVPASHPLYTYVETAHAHGAINGATRAGCVATGATYPCFLPNDNVTRAQTAIITQQAFGWPTDTTGGPHFTDVAQNFYAYAAIETCYHHVVVNGIGGGLFAPNQSVTRAQIAVILYKAITLP